MLDSRRWDVTTDEQFYSEVKRYVRFDEADEKRLAVVHGLVQPHFADVAESFYDRVREFEGAHSVLKGEEQIARLKSSMVSWLDRVLSGPYGKEHIALSARVGAVHVRVGLSHRYVVTGISFLRARLHHIIAAAEVTEPALLHGSVDKVLDLELAVMMESYCDHYLGRIERINQLPVHEDEGPLSIGRRRAMEHAPALVIGLDDDGRVLVFNHAAERVTGFGADEARGQLFDELLLTGPGRSEFRTLLERIVLGGRQSAGAAPAQTDLPIVTRASQERVIRWQFSGSTTVDGGALIVAVGTDVTEEKSQQEHARRTERLAAVGSLAAGLAHEIRNPLNGAQLHVTFIQRGLRRLGIQDEDTIEALEVVRQEITRLGGLVQEFLDFARPKALQREPTSLTEICTRVLQLSAPGAEAAQVTLRHDLPATDVVAPVDPGKIEQVLLNLLQNAIEASSHGARVTLTLRRLPRWAKLAVEDQGPGLTSKDAPIFDPFFSTKPQGTGLGLAIAHRIVTDHGGFIMVDSHPGHTVFEVRLPVDAPGSPPEEDVGKKNAT